MADPIYTTAPSLERQAIEVFLSLKTLENQYNLDFPNAPFNNVSITLDPADRAIYLSAKIECDFIFQDGEVVMRGTEYLPSVGS
jgi:hypothetical protein